MWKVDESKEPLLNEDDIGRYTLMNPKYPEAKEMWEIARASNWELGEINFSQDRAQIANNLIPEHEWKMIILIIGGFNVLEGIVGEGPCINMYTTIQSSEYRLWFAQQLSTESLHEVTYQFMFELLAPNENIRNSVISELMSLESVKRKREWSLKWNNNNSPLVQKNFAYAIIEGVFFSSSFAIMGWLKKGRSTPILTGIHDGNELIRADEYSHVSGFASVNSNLINKLPENLAIEMIKECVDAETLYSKEIITSNIVGISSDSMRQFIEFMSDTIMSLFEYKKIYNSNNPFEWMNTLGLVQRVSFFEEDTRNYFRKGSGVYIDQDAYVPSEDF